MKYQRGPEPPSGSRHFNPPPPPLSRYTRCPLAAVSPIRDPKCFSISRKIPRRAPPLLFLLSRAGGDAEGGAGESDRVHAGNTTRPLAPRASRVSRENWWWTRTAAEEIQPRVGTFLTRDIGRAVSDVDKYSFRRQLQREESSPRTCASERTTATWQSCRNETSATFIFRLQRVESMEIPSRRREHPICAGILP